MWERAQLKSYAKQELKISYWLSFAVCIVAGLLGAGSGGGGGGSAGSASSSSYGGENGNFFGTDLSSVEIMGIVFISIIVLLVVLGFTFFISNPVIVGKSSFFIRAPYGDRKFSNLFSSFSNGRYMPIVKTMFMMNLYIFLWSLLFIIPGIIKSYEYRMVPYIISDDPSLTPAQAIDLSRRMTQGEKWRMFVLDLSFIGWYLLGTLALLIGVLFVTPYYEATIAQLYFALRPKVMMPPQSPYIEPVI